MTGTPKTLREAIKNAADEAKGQVLIGANPDVERIAYAHVVDFINQKFSAAVMIAEQAGNKNLADALFTLHDSLVKDIR